ncbi:diguanylate cyclase [Alloactinosynnema sp. L-07]|uniref:GGDEF domain-containing protein n=1 Tax=Alloactinosynnema sp. L-07 TaxID=1653480 RepID=UPI0006B6526E|nr:GGDEF domain-containing protein [Alloactinosynnema sp. L-07]
MFGRAGVSVSRSGFVVKGRTRDKNQEQSDSLWDLGGATIAVVLLIDLIGALAVTARAIGAAPPRLADWLLFLALLTAAIVYVWLTRPVEERRRGARLAQRTVEHVDQTSIFFAAAGLTLPTLLAVALVVVIRYRRFLVARKPIGLWTSNTFTVLLSVVGVGWVRDLIGGATWLSGSFVADLSTGVRSGVVLGAAIAVYFLAQAVPIGLYRGVRFGAWTLGATLGAREDNLLIVHTLVLGMFAALVTAHAPILLPVIVALAVRDSRMVGRLATTTADALTDPLTSLPNRRAFDLHATVALEIDRAGRQPTSLLMLDLDHFKAWNTTLGHLGADQVLVAVADILRKVKRKGDLIARWGGEELAMVLPNTDPHGAEQIAERIRVAVEDLRLAIRKPAGGVVVCLGTGGVPNCTISIGAATSPHHAVDLPALQECADQALELAKQLGRNRVVSFQPRGSERVLPAVETQESTN